MIGCVANYRSLVYCWYGIWERPVLKHGPRSLAYLQFMQVSDRSDPNLVIIACKVTQFLTNFVDFHPRFLCDIDFALGCIKVNGESLNHFDIDEFPAEKRRELAIVAACSLFHHKSPNPLR